MSQFNASELNRLAMADSQIAAGLREAEVRLESAAELQNAAMQNQRDQFNAQNRFIMEQATLEYERKTNMANTAAENEMNKLNAQQNFSVTMTEYQANLTEARDQANFLRQQELTDDELKTRLYIAAIGNETAAGKDSQKSIDSLLAFIRGLNI
jgi:hypothetical protein